MKKLKITILVITVMIVVFGIVNFVKANPSFFTRDASTNTATTTVNYLTPGTGTTTLSWDAWKGPTGNRGTTLAADSATLLVQFAGTTTPTNPIPQLNINLEYSQDGADWYSDKVTTTTPNTLTGLNTYNWQFASTTQGGLIGSTGTSTRIFNVPTPTRFTRVIFSIPAGAGNGAVWAEFVGKRQTVQ